MFVRCLLLTVAFVLAAPLGAFAQHTAVKPVPRDAGWMKRHEAFVEIAKKGEVELLFLGDSITDSWGGEGHPKGSPGAKVFEREFLPLKAANFGISGDRTQHVLWRLQNGELDGLKPKVVMLMIGTNNSNAKDNTAQEIAEGVKAIVSEIHKKSPQTKVLLLAIFPRGKDNVGAMIAQRQKIVDANKIIAQMDDKGTSVKYLDIGKGFLNEKANPNSDLMPDYLHLSPKGYQIWADAVKPTILELMGMKPEEKPKE